MNNINTVMILQVTLNVSLNMFILCKKSVFDIYVPDNSGLMTVLI